LRRSTLPIRLLLSALGAGADQHEGTEALAREHVQAVHAQRLLLVALAVFTRAGAGVASWRSQSGLSGFADFQAGAPAALVDAEVVVRLHAVDAGLQIPRWVDDRILGVRRERGAQDGGGEGNVFRFIQNELPILLKAFLSSNIVALLLDRRLGIFVRSTCTIPHLSLRCIKSITFPETYSLLFCPTLKHGWSQ
jgi:hypothetical protein